MAIVDARILRTLKLSETKEKQTKKLSATQDFLVVSDTKNPSFADILANTDTFVNLSNTALPQLGDQVTVNGVELYVSARNLSWHEDSDRAVMMSVQYSGFEADASASDPNNEDEASWRRFSMRTQQITKPAMGWTSFVDADVANAADYAAPRNTAGDPVEGLESDVAMLAMTYTNPDAATVNFDSLNDYVNVCNDVQFRGRDAYTVRCIGYSADYDEKTQSWSVVVDFLYNPDGWQIKYIDAGFNELTGGARKVIKDDAGNPVSMPVPLDGFGVALEEANIDNVVTLELYPYQMRNLNNLFDDAGI